MKITIYNYGYKPGQKISLEIECKGEGTKENPLIIEPSDKIPKNFIVRGYKYNLVLKGFKLRYILVENCQNITIEDTELTRLRMDHCSKIAIRNFTCFSRLTLYRCEDVTIETSFIAQLRLFKASDNSITNNYIIRLMEIGSKNNGMELNDITKVQRSISLNYLVTEYARRFAWLFMGYIIITISSIPFISLGDNFKLRLIIASVPISMFGVLIGVFVAVLINMAIIRPVIIRRNKRLIEKEKTINN